MGEGESADAGANGKGQLRHVLLRLSEEPYT